MKSDWTASQYYNWTLMEAIHRDKQREVYKVKQSFAQALNVNRCFDTLG